MSAEKRIRTALVTGASSGIGLELAKLLASAGYDLVLVARNQERLRLLAADLEKQYGISARIIAKDLSIARVPDEIFGELQGEGVPVHVLVNNAGFGTYGFFSESDGQVQLQEMQVNMVALTHLTRLFLGQMLDRREGMILNVSSTAAFQPGPKMAIYYATKAYVLSFTEALANELHGTGVSATVLCPGPTPTEFQTRAGIQKTRLVHRLSWMSASEVARIGYSRLVRGKTVVVAGRRNRLIAFLFRFVPRKITAQIVRDLHTTA